DAHLARTPRCLDHPAAPEIDRDVLAAAGTVEDQVAALGLRRRDGPAGVVLVARVLRDLHAHPGEGGPREARAAVADLARVVVPPRPRTGQCAAAPRVRHTHLRAA